MENVDLARACEKDKQIVLQTNTMKQTTRYKMINDIVGVGKYCNYCEEQIINVKFKLLNPTFLPSKLKPRPLSGDNHYWRGK